MSTQVPAGESTSLEKSLVERVRRGEWLDLIPKVPRGETIDGDTMRSWGHSQTCSATVIRDILRGQRAANPDPHGLRLRGAKITGRLDLENVTTDVRLELADCLLEEGVLARDARLTFVGLIRCQLEHPAKPPLDGTRLTCNVLFLGGARIIGHANDGAVSLLGARIGVQFDCEEAELRNDSGPALDADGLHVGQDMSLRGLTASGSGDSAAVSLLGARIGGLFDCSGAELRNDSGPALDAEGLQVDRAMLLREVTATGRGKDGAVGLVSARIDGQITCGGAELHNDSGPALNGENLQAGQGVFLRRLTATGSGEYGAIRLFSAHIGGSLDCAGAEVRNDSGPALNADGLQVDQAIVLRSAFIPTSGNNAGVLRRFAATGSGDAGAVSLLSARIGVQFDCEEAELRNDSGPALDADGLHVGQDMFLRGEFTATGGGKDVAVDLTGARVGGTFVFAPAQLGHTADSQRRLGVDGLTYAGVPEQISVTRWLELLRYGTPGYAAQPYQQLAAGYRALGNDRQARQTLMAQRDDQLARGKTSRWERWWGTITKVTLGYGYQPWRALWFLAGVVAVSCILAVVLGAHGALAQTSKTAAPGRSCTVVQQVSVGLDLNLPVGTSVARAACDLTTDPASATGAWLTAVGWVLRVLAWVFAALFIAGFTSAVRKT